MGAQHLANHRPWRVRAGSLLLVARLGILAVLFAAAAIIALQGTGLLSQPHVTATDMGYVRQTPAKLVTHEQKLHITTPVRLIIPRLDIGLDIDSATINKATNNWPLSDTKAQYANFTSGLGNQRGTLLLYGHHSWSVLHKTDTIQIGDRMTLVDNEGKSWLFELYDQYDVTPDQVGFIYEDVPFRVVMFTCDGWNDSHRRLMFFHPVSAL